MSFHRELLPAPRTFYSQELHQLGKERRAWARALCPFHPDKNPSFDVNLSSGGFKCWSCGAKGGDIVAFVMLRYGLDFKAATQHLGAWVDEPLTPASRRELANEIKSHERLQSSAEKLAELEQCWILDLQCEMAQLDNIEVIAKRHLARSRQDPTINEEDGWALLEIVLVLQRRAVAAYYLLAFGSERDRADFVLDPGGRESLIIRVITCGYVRTENAKYVEVPLP